MKGRILSNDYIKCFKLKREKILKKKILIAIGVLVGILIFTNPSEESLIRKCEQRNYSAMGLQMIQLEIAESTSFVLFSIGHSEFGAAFGGPLKVKYFGVLGNWYII